MVQDRLPGGGQDDPSVPPSDLRGLYLGGQTVPVARRFVAVTGQPGAGKRRLALDAAHEITGSDDTVVHLDSDALREHVPGYAALSARDLDAAFQLSQPIVSRWADWLRDTAIAAGYNLVLEGLFKTEATTRTLWLQLADRNYRRALHLRFVPPLLSLLQIEYRFERQMQAVNERVAKPSLGQATASARETVPRRVSPDNHNLAIAAQPGLLATVIDSQFDEVLVVDLRGRSLIAARGPQVDHSVLARHSALRAAPLSAAELAVAGDRYVQILRMRLSRGASVDPEPGSALEAATRLLAEFEAAPPDP